MFQFEPIGVIRTDFQEKIGLPRQSLMLTEARGLIQLHGGRGFDRAVEELSEFSHLWLIFVFDRHVGKAWRPAITPPRSRGLKRVGVFASRSPHRPNPIGLSVLKIEEVRARAKPGPEIEVSGVDLLDQTPVLDLKPYLPFADAHPEAKSGWSEPSTTRSPVSFSESALKTLSEASLVRPSFQKVLVQVLELDPRAARVRKVWPLEDPHNEGRSFAFRFQGFDVRWKILAGHIHVTDLRPLS